TISASIAFDPRSRRYLVLWDGAGPTERIAPCGPSFPGTPAPPCSQPRYAVYGRLLDARGRPVGPQRRYTGRGAPSGLAGAETAALMARRTGGFLAGYNTCAERCRAGTFTITARGRRATAPRPVPADGCERCLLAKLLPFDSGALAVV